MSEIMKKYEQIAAADAVRENNLEKIQALINKGCDKKFILDIGFAEDEYEEAQKEMQTAN